VRLSLLVFAVSLLAAAPVVAAPPQPPKPVLVDMQLPTYDEVGLEWKRGPNASDLSRRYPVRGYNMGVRRGVAQMDCTARVNGRLDCKVLNESPPEMGFGEAGLRVMQPVTVQGADGTSPEGKRFGFTLKFGRWPASAAPSAKHLNQFGLTWAKLPTLSQRWWGVHGRAYEVDMECDTREDGSVDCRLLTASDPDFGAFAIEGMKSARVRAIDGKPLAARRFNYGFTYTRS
jgi:hypothetical protein